MMVFLTHTKDIEREHEDFGELIHKEFYENFAMIYDIPFKVKTVYKKNYIRLKAVNNEGKTVFKSKELDIEGLIKAIT